MDYWNSTAELTGTGRPVDAFILPCAPFAAARPGRYSYYGYSTIVNILDYVACAIPVTEVEQSVDVKNTTCKAMNELDQMVLDDCTSLSSVCRKLC